MSFSFKQVIQLFREVPNLASPPTAPRLIAPICDSDGAPYTKLTGDDGGSSVKIGAIIPGDTRTTNGIYGLVSFDAKHLYFPDVDQWARERGNYGATILTGAARTATTNSDDQINYNNKGVQVIVNVTAGTGLLLTPNIQGKDPMSGNYYNLLQGVTITGTGTYVFHLYPGISEIANQKVNACLPKTWRISVTHDNANSATYSVGGNFIL